MHLTFGNQESVKNKRNLLIFKSLKNEIQLTNSLNTVINLEIDYFFFLAIFFLRSDKAIYVI